jgi:Hint domain-containing protein
VRALVLALGVTLVAACGGAATVRGTPGPSATVGFATITPAGTVTATAITGTIVPGTGTIPPSTIPPAPTPAPSVTPSPAPGGLTQAQLKYRLIDQLGRLLFCDPDYYPVARADEQALAHQRLPDIQKDAPTFSAILSHLGIAPAATYTSEQELAIYRDWKMLNTLRLEAVSAGFHFVAIFSTAPNTQQGSRVDGTIDQRGNVTIASRTPSGQPPCPICLARGTRIATPSGDVAVEDLRLGDLVWTLDGSGGRVAAGLVSVGSMPVPSTHHVVRLVLSDGRAVSVSPGHPTASGRNVGDLVAGEEYDGARIVSHERVSYGGGATFDVLPAGATGFYWANGVLLGSTLR